MFAHVAHETPATEAVELRASGQLVSYVFGQRDKVDITGVITLRHNSRLHHIGLGRRLSGTRVIVLIDGLRIRVLTEDGKLLRELTLDPSRDYQPKGGR